MFFLPDKNKTSSYGIPYYIFLKSKSIILNLSFNQAIRESKSFRNYPTGYGFKDNERCVEIEFIRNYYQGENIVLDVGYTNAEPRYISMIQSLCIPHLIGLDLSPPKITTGYNETIRGDIRQTNFHDNTFDSIFCVSTLEHVGMNNDIYKNSVENNPESHIAAMREMYRILKPKGKLLLTLPFRKYFDYNWFLQYDLDSLQNIVINSNFKTKFIQSYKVNKYWEFCLSKCCSSISYQESNHRAGAVVCIVLSK